MAIPQSAVIIVVLGLAGGWFVEEDRRGPYMLMTLTLALVHGALGPIPGIGGYLTDILGSLSALLNAGALYGHRHGDRRQTETVKTYSQLIRRGPYCGPFLWLIHSGTGRPRSIYMMNVT